jgi:predicted  nucleic acid-binding Zn-ribbon protein
METSMASCNMQIMMGFSCEELREKRRRANLNIASDQRDRDRLVSEIRRIEIQIADKRAEIRRIQNRLPDPSIQSLVPTDDHGRKRPPKPWEIVVDVVQAAASPAQNRFTIQQLEREIGELETDLPDLRQRRWDRQERLNEMIAGRACINDAMRRKGCIGA